MPTWKYHLNIKTEWEQAQEFEISVQELSKVIADRLEAIDFEDADDNYRAEDLVDNFRDLAEDQAADFSDFNIFFEELYDFADGVRLWVQTVI